MCFEVNDCWDLVIILLVIDLVMDVDNSIGFKWIFYREFCYVNCFLMFDCLSSVLDNYWVKSIEF